MNGNVIIERQDHVLLIGIDRVAKRNAFSPEMFVELGRAYHRLESDKELRCGLLYAKGEHFTAGLDLAAWAPLFAAGKFSTMDDGAIDPLGLDESKRVKKPVVMAAQGICLTIGMELLLSTDIRIAASNLRMAQIEIKRGIYPVGGGTTRLIQEIGWSNAMRYLLTGDEISAAEALRMGLVQEVVEPGQEFDRALALARLISAQAPLGVRATLLSARLSRSQGEQAANQRLLPDLIPIMQSRDVQEGLRSFLERRPAVFTGE